jgi:hypothetical protein
MRLRHLAPLLLMCLPLAQAPAQTPRDLTAQATAMKDLAFLKGRWLGRGYRLMVDGKRADYTQTMLVEAKAGGILLSIEGLSLRHAEDAGKPGTGSFAVVGYDDRARRYEFRSFGFGEMIPADARLVRPGVFEWTTAGPLMFRFTVDGSVPNEWRETGERSTDGGKTWTPTHALTAWRVDAR